MTDRRRKLFLDLFRDPGLIYGSEQVCQRPTAPRGEPDPELLDLYDSEGPASETKS